MQALKEKKRALVASVLNAEHGGALKFTEAVVEDLFGAAYRCRPSAGGGPSLLPSREQA